MVPSRYGPNYVGCFEALQSMPATSGGQMFSKSGKSGDVQLPWKKDIRGTLTCLLVSRFPHRIRDCNQLAPRSIHRPALAAGLSPEIFESFVLDDVVKLTRVEAGRCQITVRPSRTRDIKVFSSWFNLWAAGIAINELCVKNGKSGTVDHINLSAASRGLLLQLGPLESDDELRQMI